jgi:hypothetical protein
MTHTPTPEGTPTQIFIRFGDLTPDGKHIRCEIGCDGEDKASPVVRQAMSVVARGIVSSFLAINDMEAAYSAWRIAEGIENAGRKEDKECHS